MTMFMTFFMTFTAFGWGCYFCKTTNEILSLLKKMIKLSSSDNEKERLYRTMICSRGCSATCSARR